MSCTTDLFGDILHPRLDRGEVFIDPARFVADPEKAQRFPELPYLTVRLAYLACEYFNADTGLALVRPAHQSFYRRVFLNETIGEPRLFPGALAKVALMASDFRAVREHVMTRFPDHALECLRAADAVPARWARLPGGRSLELRAGLDRSEPLSRPRRLTRNLDKSVFRSPAGGAARSPKPLNSAADALAFTVAPHLQTINHRGRFSPFGGI